MDLTKNKFHASWVKNIALLKNQVKKILISILYAIDKCIFFLSEGNKVNPIPNLDEQLGAAIH